MNAMEVARSMYEADHKDFDKVLSKHLLKGIVLSSPLWFIMLRAEVWEGELAWFVECAVGNLKDLANLVALKLPKIAFCRVKNGKKQTKIYSTQRLVRLVQRDIAIP